MSPAAAACCVAGCQRVEGGGDDVTYFPFPVSLPLRRTWRAVLPSHSNITSDAMVCSRHFTSKDYETVRGKMRLKRRVIPSRFGQACTEPEPPLEHSPPAPTRPTRPSTRRQTRSTRTQHVQDTTSSEEEDSECSEDDGSDPEFKLKTKAVTKAAPRGGKRKASNNTNDANDETQSNDDKDDERAMNGDDNGDETANGDEMQVTPDIGGMMEMMGQYGDDEHDAKDKCTIECVPEIHPQESGSDDEKPANEDIEDIIANYHIKQDKELAERLLAAQAVERERLERERRERERKEKEMQEKKEKDRLEAKRKDNDVRSKVADILYKKNIVSKTKSVYRPPRPRPRPASGPAHTASGAVSSDDDCIDTTPLPNYVEIAVGDGAVDDCMMLMEDVQVLCDPQTLMMDDQDMEHSSHGVYTNITRSLSESPPASGPPAPAAAPALAGVDPISLLTSSDDDDVIIQEPHIDKIEVSDETDEDDIPLTRIAATVAPSRVQNVQKVNFNPKVLWNSTMEYFCYECHWKTSSAAAFSRHKRKHDEARNGPDTLYGLDRKRRKDCKDGNLSIQHTVMRMCDQCEFSTASAPQLAKHKHRHKTDKRYSCTLCEYRARHRMALHYHMRAHETVRVDVRAPHGKVAHVTQPKMRYRCQSCHHKSSTPAEMLRHSRSCRKPQATNTHTNKHKRQTKTYKCKRCDYTTDRASDLRRHKGRKHKGSDDDHDYEP